MKWQEEFLELFKSENIEDYIKSLKLKREHIPARLYRYRSVTDGNILHRINEIEYGELYLSHPEELNDPFEIRSMLHSKSPGVYFQVKDIFLRTFGDKLNPEEIERIFGKDDFLEDFVEYVVRKSASSDKVAENKEALLKISMNVIKKFTSDKDALFRSMIRLACFSTTPNNLPMWHHYTNGHTGICLEFDTNQIKNQYQTNYLFPVYYVDKLPDTTIDIFNKTNSRFSVLEIQAIHKLKEWSYENEWRLIYCFGALFGNSEEQLKELFNHGKIVDFIRPSRIILGINIADEHEQVIRCSAKKFGIPVTKAELTQYGIKIE